MAGGIAGLFFNASLIDVFESSKVAETLWILLGIAAGTAFLYRTDFAYKKYIIKTLTSNFFTVFYLFFIFVAFFLKSVANFFVADDFTWLKWAATTNLSDLPKLFIDSQGFFYRPLDKLAMFFLYTLFSFNFQGYHIFMLMVHFLTGFGVYLIINKIFKNRLLSFVGAFMFLFLPSQAENVFWISTISTNLATLFTVFMLVFWLNFREKTSKMYYVLSLFFAVFALLSYEGSIIIFPILILIDLFIVKIRTLNLKNILLYCPFAVVTVLYPFIRNLSHSVTYWRRLFLQYFSSRAQFYRQLYRIFRFTYCRRAVSTTIYNCKEFVKGRHSLCIYIHIFRTDCFVCGFVRQSGKTNQLA